MILQIVSKIENFFGVNLPASAFFECATIKQPALSLRTLMSKQVEKV